jgi:hypothetical protein
MRGIGDEREAIYPWKTRMNKSYAALFIANARRTAREHDCNSLGGYES